MLLHVFLGIAFMAAAMPTSHAQALDHLNDIKLDKIHHLAKNQPARQVTDVRLPTSLKPLHYIIKLQPFLEGNFSIVGSVEIEIEVLAPTTNVTLHILDIVTKNETIKLVASDDLAGPGVAITQHLYDQDRQFYIALLGEELVVGKTYILTIGFIGTLNDILVGFYRSSYIDETGVSRMLAVTQFEATDARRAFPCFDEPAMKATFEVFLARENKMTSISNMPLLETFPIADQPGWAWDHFTTSLPMSTYLVAFMVSDFIYVESNANDHVLFRVWARRGAINDTAYALNMGPKVLTFYEDYFNIPFPLPKQDMAAIPDFDAGAMENWGLITYRETALLYKPGVSTASNKQRVAVVIAHELAHMWFGDLVTMKWWDDLWLNEGFASFMENVGTNFIEPDFKMFEQFITNDLQYAFELDCLESSHPISIPVQNPDEINAIFDSISYSKGASIIRMMNFFLTDATFRKGINSYLTNLTYSNAQQDDLWAFMTTAAREDGTLPAEVTVKTIMDTWTLQMGYPVITVTRSLDGTSATVSQERFLLVKNPNSTDTHDYRWWVPVTYASQNNPDFTQTKPSVWIQETPNITITGLPSSSEWVIFNLQETGYYRVNYDDKNWNLIIQQLQTNHSVINTINRAQVIDDALNLARAGLVSYVTALSINDYLSSETEYVPWVAALNNLGYLEDMFVRTGGYGQLKTYLLSILVPFYNSVGFEDNLNDPHLEQYKRSLALSWTCSLGYADCVSNSVRLYQQWMLDPTNASIISPNLKQTVYCTAIAEGSEAEWNFAWNQYLVTDLASDQIILLKAMGCSKETWILSRYLDLTFTEGSRIRKQDSNYVFRAVSYNDVGQFLAWNYLRDQYQNIAQFYGYTAVVGEMTATVSYNFNTNQELREVEQFKTDTAAFIGTAGVYAMNQALEGVRVNIAWMQSHYDEILQWLINNP